MTMPSLPPVPIDSDANRRRWERCPVVTPKGNAVLEVGTAKLPILLFDQSPGGVGVLVKTPPSFWVDDVGRLTTANAEYRVRVVYVARADADSSTADGPPTEFRIGLECLEKLSSSPSQPGRLSLGQILWIWFSSLLPIERSGVLAGTLLAFLLIATPILVAVMAWKPDLPSPSHWMDPVREVCTRSFRNGHFETISAKSPASKPGDSDPTTGELCAIVRNLPGAEPFLRPAVAKRLRLTPAQRTAVEQLHETTQQALHDFDAYWGGTGRPGGLEKRAMIEDTARREALRLLTAAQRQLWEQISAGGGQ